MLNFVKSFFFFLESIEMIIWVLAQLIVGPGALGLFLSCWYVVLSPRIAYWRPWGSPGLMPACLCAGLCPHATGCILGGYLGTDADQLVDEARAQH